MITLPKGITLIIERIESKGYEAYVVGGSIRDLLLGLNPEDWDLASNMPVEEVLELFPHVATTGSRFGVVQVKEGDTTADVAAFRTDGDYTDHRRPDKVTFTDKIEEDLARRDFTVNGMAYNPQKGLVDPFDGRRDLKSKSIRTIGDPETRLSEDPLRILRGIRLAGQLDFDIIMDTFSAMQKTAPLLDEISMDRRRQELLRLLVTKNAGKALRMCVAANVMPALLGDCYPPRRRQNQGDLEKLIQNIDKSRPQADLRLSLLLLCFEKSKALKVIEYLSCSKELSAKLTAAINLMEDLYFSADKYSLKRFIYLHGEETYTFLDSLSKQLREVYDIPGYRIESRYYILEEIRKNKEPMYAQDLAITGKDLIDAGIAAGEQVGQLLSMLVDVVHRFPGLNTKPKLLKKAKELKKPLHAKFRNIHFFR